MNANDLFKAVMELDLTPIKTKLMHVASGEGWSLEKANAVEKEYRRFLCLMQLFPEEQTAPLVDVDTFWHYHILDTMKYAADCERAFGRFLHHYPYVGLDGSDEDEQMRLDSGERMRELYENVFGEAYPAAFDDDVHAAAYCGGEFPPGKQMLAAGAMQAATAYCGGEFPPGTQAKTAYCGGEFPPGKQTKTAYCGGEFPPGTQAKTAYCGGEFPPGKQASSAIVLKAKTAYCGGEFPPGKQARNASVIQAKTAYCGGEFPPGKKAASNLALAA